MKGSERRHLKENELTHALTRVAEQRRIYTMVGVGALVVVLAAGGYWAWHTRNETQAQVMLTDALTIVQSPVEAPKPDANGKLVQAPGTYLTVTARAEAALVKFNQAANAYPSTKAGIAARYYSASALGLTGKSQEAAARYQEVIDKAGTKGFYGRMAQLGLIDSLIQAKQYDQAIAKAQALTNANDESLPRDAALMELGRAYAAAGKKTEARQTFEKIVTEFPESVFLDEAKALSATST